MKELVFRHGKRTFGEECLWDKVFSVLMKCLKDAAELALTLFYCMKDGDTPAWAKAKIAAALGYFIWPIDLIPDALPGGYIDDIAVMTAATAVVAASIKKVHRRKARMAIERFLRRDER